MAEAALRIPNVELLGELGRGASSVVYRARHDGGEVAVKVPHSSGDQGPPLAQERRFWREAAILARLKHPVLPTVLEVGSARGTPFLIMELVPGPSLASTVRQRTLSPDEVENLARQLTGALAKIHAAGLVHRDVKPHNILYEPTTGRVSLIDFGLAQQISSGGTGSTSACHAPEITSSFALLGSGTDLYSLGCVLFESVTGARPTGDSSSARVRQLESTGVSTALATVISKLVETEPHARYNDAHHVLRDLGVLGESVEQLLDTTHVSHRAIGRQNELRQLRLHWNGGRSGGCVAILHGSAGFGKTHLANVFLRELADESALVVRAACPSNATGNFSAVRELFDAYVARLDAMPGAQRAEGFARMRRAAGGLGSLLKLLSPRLAPVFASAPTLPRTENAEHVFAEGLAEVLRRILAEVGPSVIFVDDVQWIDPSSRRVLRRLLDGAGELSTLFLFGARDLSGWEDFKVLLPVVPLEIELPPLSLEASVELARAFLNTNQIDTSIGETLARFTNGSPLLVLEVLRSLLDQGALRPHWGRWVLDEKNVAVAELPAEVNLALARRLGQLAPTARRVLVVGAILGDAFEDDLVREVCELGADELTGVLAESIQRQLIRTTGAGKHVFVHHAVRDALLSGVDENEEMEVHQRVAEALDQRLTTASSLQFEFEQDPSGARVRGHAATSQADYSLADADRDGLGRLASHYARGTLEKSPRRAFDVNLEAARRAFESLEDDRALGFLRAAERVARFAGTRVPIALRLLEGQAHLRAGAHESSLAAFRDVLDRSEDGLVRTSALLKIAAVYGLQYDSEREWASIQKAFDVFGVPMPEVRPGALVRTVGAFARSRRTKPRIISDEAERHWLEVFCALHYQLARFSQTTGKPEVLVLATLASLGPAERLGDSLALVKAYTAYAFVLTVAGLEHRGDRYLAEADRIAKRLKDPVAESHVVQLRSVVDAWGGKWSAAVENGARCVRDHGLWRELGDVCWLSHNQNQILSLRGCSREAWQALLPVVQRIRQHEGAPVVPEVFALGAEAALEGLGRKAESAQLLERVWAATVPIPTTSKLYLVAHAAAIRRFTESMRLDEVFERHVESFDALGQDPKKVHLVLTEYYVHVAYARVHQMLRAKQKERVLLSGKLKKAFHDLQRAARAPLIEAHARAVAGYVSWFAGRLAEAEDHFHGALRLGEAEEAPWVLYSVYRGRAHMLAEAGHASSARDQALAAYTLAKEHGAVYRARWIQEEFGVRPHGSDESWGSSSPLTTTTQDSLGLSGSRARRQLRALLRISQARAHELDPDHQARIVVDELVHGLRADRGILLLKEGLFVGSIGKGGKIAGLAVACARDNDGRDLQDGPRDLDEEILREAFTHGVARAANEGHSLTMRASVGTTARLSTIAAPLVVNDEVAGVIYLDRGLGGGAFTDADGEVLAALAAQVSVVLELSRSLHVREISEENRRSAEKMEAIGRLASSIAHDLNNMLAAIRYATAAILSSQRGAAVAEDVHVIQSAARRAEELTRQLRAFSRGEFARKEVVWLNERIRRFVPMLKGLLGERIELDVVLSEDVEAVVADPDQIDQIITNLVVNARDAMPDGGKLGIVNANVELTEDYTRMHPRIRPGRYVQLTISDTGVGMTADTVSRIFEPFFTTKSDKGGTGLGLASVYGMMDKAGGHIEVASEPGKGSLFKVYWPSQGMGSRPAATSASSETILVVDPDAMTRADLEDKLLSLGYAVISCRAGREALELARNRTDIRLVVASVLTPGMNALELDRELAKLEPRPRVLHVARDTGGVVAERGIFGERVEFLRSPVTKEALSKRVKALLGG